MNPGQEQFLNFILERIQDGKQEEARTLLVESFDKKASGAFNGEYMKGFGMRMLAMLKPEHVQEVQAIMTQYGSGNH